MPVNSNPAMATAVQQALQRRAQGGAAPQLSQVSPQAPTTDQTQPMNPSDMGQPDIPQAGSQAPIDPENEMIIKALIDTLKMNKKANIQAQNVLPMGGGYAQNNYGGGGNQDYIQNKIGILRNEGYPQDQATAIAYSMRDRK
jgi:hypothetical protein